MKLKFIVKDGSLVLRISEGKERYYKSVKHLLTGSPNLERHWNADKERFTCNAISYSENNKALEEFKSTYTKLLLEHPELAARQVASYFQPIKQVGIIAPSCAKNNKILEDYKNVYRKLMFEYPEFSARQIASFYGHINKTSDFDLMYNHVKSMIPLKNL